jgi:hypothetical protein
VLVQVLAGSDPEKEAGLEQRRCRRGGLRNDGRMDADQGTRDPGTNGESVGLHRDGTEHGPDEGALALPVGPGMEVV